MANRAQRRRRRRQDQLDHGIKIPPPRKVGECAGDEACRCEECDGHKAWPVTVMGSDGRAWECIEINRWEWAAENTRWGESRTGHHRSGATRITKREAQAMGMHMVRHRKGEPRIYVMRAGCEGVMDDGKQCNALRVAGEKFCSDCRRKMLRKMEDSGYFDGEGR